jgi:hypothetical protein
MPKHQAPRSWRVRYCKLEPARAGLRAAAIAIPHTLRLRKSRHETAAFRRAPLAPASRAWHALALLLEQPVPATTHRDLMAQEPPAAAAGMALVGGAAASSQPDRQP